MYIIIIYSTEGDIREIRRNYFLRKFTSSPFSCSSYKMKLGVRCRQERITFILILLYFSLSDSYIFEFFYTLGHFIMNDFVTHYKNEKLNDEM